MHFGIFLVITRTLHMSMAWMYNLQNVYADFYHSRSRSLIHLPTFSIDQLLQQ